MEESITTANEDRAHLGHRHRVCDQVLLVVVTHFWPRSLVRFHKTHFIMFEKWTRILEGSVIEIPTNKITYCANNMSGIDPNNRVAKLVIAGCG